MRPETTVSESAVVGLGAQNPTGHAVCVLAAAEAHAERVLITDGTVGLLEDEASEVADAIVPFLLAGSRPDGTIR